MKDIPTADIIDELMQRARLTGNIDAMAALALVIEAFPSQPPAATPVVSPTAQSAPQAAPASHTPAAPVAASAAVAGQPEPAPMLKVTLPPGSPYRAVEVGALVQTLVSRFLRGDLPPLSMRCMQLAADIVLLEEVRNAR